ncbi:30S ribosomal protein S4 [candidate division WWE3 bacterium CG08_land_8_20_14_0_20_40_13]|uniref:Small ribosomal subunit protein uS4 n=1 Tax=candidate division WWE3 bacterium CG08_land_8_20_14_0_20_40_13 TaxID=1975084 RepID=A0A2H0XGV0_UNCKA|nr:MAG: 30S ribosomal protein S4 [candidate division WWE3 bacterium CG08_land_8_20_14_0_20_40_13]
MARYTGPKCRLCRREGTKLFLKGVRCESEKCGLTRRQSAPGVHGTAHRRKASDFGIQLREKQKVKRIYGVLERQFRKYFDAASKKSGVTGEFLLVTLERRLDNAVYRSNLAVSRAQARKYITEKKIMVNGKTVSIPSFSVKKGDKISSDYAKVQSEKELPVWITAKAKDFEILGLPVREDIKEDIQEQLIVEFYSR